MNLFYLFLLQIISRKCGCGIQDEPPQFEEDHADVFSLVVKPYTPQANVIKDIKATKNELDSENDKKEKDISIKNDNSKKTIGYDCKNISDSSNRFDTKLNDIKDLKVSDIGSLDNDAKVQKPDALQNTQNHCKKISEIITDCSGNVVDGNRVDSKLCDSDIKDENTNDIEKIERTNNLFCNRCNNIKSSVSFECTCDVKSENSRDSVKNKVDSGKDLKKFIDNEMASVDLSSAIALINR